MEIYKPEGNTFLSSLLVA